MVKRIVLTGGPCGGKTTAIKEIRNKFEKEGYIVLNINETATEIMQMGIKPFGNNSISMYEFQKYVFSEQLQNEKLLERYIKEYKDKNIIALYDRCIIDNKSYVSEDEFNELMKEFNINEEEYISKIDLFIHMVSAAVGTDEYTLSNNEVRSESKSEAKVKDDLIKKCYDGIKNHIVVDNSTNFEDKVDKVINLIENIL